MINLFNTKKKIIILLIIIILFPLFFFTLDIARFGYDKQNKVILAIKSIIPPHYLRKIRDNVYIIPRLKAKIETLELQVKKFEQGNGSF